MGGDAKEIAGAVSWKKSDISKIGMDRIFVSVLNVSRCLCHVVL